MTIFKSRQVNLDPRPWRGALGSRFETEDQAIQYHPGVGGVFDPRPETTRDPEPWLDPATKGDENEVRWATVDHIGRAFYEWAPRREQFDTPVNRVLVQLRGEHALVGHSLPARAQSFLSDLDGDWKADFTPAEIDHARPILTRLANFKNGATS